MNKSLFYFSRSVLSAIVLLASSCGVFGQDKKEKTANKVSLHFEYSEPPKTPIKEEWIATVSRRGEPHGKAVEQKMTETLLYEPGNYKVEINTFPKDTRNIDLDPAYETVISISRPGFAKFVATTSNPRTLTLFLLFADKYIPFYTLDLNDPKAQHLNIQPGKYQAHYKSSRSETDAVVDFRVKPDEETIVKLR